MKGMTYQFSTDDKSVQAAVRRIARGRVDAALARAPALPEVGSIHGIRKETKKLRGLLQLVKPRFKGFAQAEAALKHGAAQLALSRDAEVRLATFDSLVAGLDKPSDAAPVRALLADEVARLHDPRLLSDATGALHDTLVQLRAGIDDWKVRSRGFDALGEGLGATWRRAQRDMKGAGRSYKGGFDAAPFHDWRRPVKHHWYHARLLLPLWPEMMMPHIAAADALGELLGDHNDLDVLVTRLAHDLPDDMAPVAARLTALALKRRRQLAGRSLVLGRWLFADRPGALVARWGRWWVLWRG